MTKKQENLKQGILNYLQMESSGALMVTGPWGCGKSYFFEHVLFDELKEKGYKPARVSLFGLSSLSDLSKSIVCEFAQYTTDNKSFGEVLSEGAKFFTKLGTAVASEYVDLKGLFGQGKILYRLVPKKSIICLDDLERAIEKYDINDLLGVINDLVENQHLKVIVIANKKYIDKQQRTKDGKGAMHEVFYEKVVEKILHFSPDILGVFDTLLNSYNGAGTFKQFMKQQVILDSINPVLAKVKSLKQQKENIRTLKFAVSHFYKLFQDYVNQGKDIENEHIKRQLLNQWLFVYALSLESKQTALSIDDCMGLDNYVLTASLNQVAQDEIDDVGPFEDDTQNIDEEKVHNIAERFVGQYYKGKENEYTFYPDLYQFVVAGVNYDFEKVFQFAEKTCMRFDYHVNPAQEIIDKWMKGFWTMTDEEAKENLWKLKEYVADGKLLNFPSYYNASVFLFKFCGIIGMTTEKLLPLFEQGLCKYSEHVVVDGVALSMMKAIGGEHIDICKPVYDLIIKIMDEKMERQKTSDIDVMKQLFTDDISAFGNLFMPNQQSTPKFFNVPVLQMLEENTIKQKMEVVTPNDIMLLYCLVAFRFNSDTGIAPMVEELPFIEYLEKYASERAQDNSRLSLVLIQDQLLPLLKKVRIKLKRKEAEEALLKAKS